MYLIDRRRPDRTRMLETWWRYLRIAWVHEPIGQRYLRRLLVSFKFELNMCVATLLTIPCVALLATFGRLSRAAAAGLFAVFLLSAILLFAAARGNVEGLVRARLVQGVGEPPFDESGNPTRRSSAQQGAEPDGRWC